jgi:hypothetical protein
LDSLPFRQSYRNRNNSHNPLGGPVVYSPDHIP